MRQAVICLMLLIASASWADEFLVRGETKSCHDFLALDRIMNGENPAPFFQDWGDRDFDAAVDWARGCISSSWQLSAYSGANREPLLRAMQQRWKTVRAHSESNLQAQKILQDEIAKQESQRVAQTKAIAADEQIRSASISDAIESREAAERSKQKFFQMQAAELAKVTECRDTNKYQLYQAQEDVIGAVDGIKSWRASQAQQRRIAAESGVRDLTEERNNGEWIVQLSDDLKGYFATYKKLGGKAPSPQKVIHQLANPCV